MPMLPKPQAVIVPKSAKRSKGKSSTERIIGTDTVEPLAGWTVTFDLVEDSSKVSKHNPDGRFIRFTKGAGYQPMKSIGIALAYSAACNKVFGD